MPARVQPLELPYLHLLRCPHCQDRLSRDDGRLHCRGCRERFPIEQGIPRLYRSVDPSVLPGDVTEKIRDFYEKNPFPDYEETDSLERLLDKAQEGIFVRLLDEQLPFGVRVLDCGCGTGQLANFLGIAHRTVFGIDLCLNSLRLGTRFKEKTRLKNVHFMQMNLFRPAFPPRSFHTVISNGVLHHTADPQWGFRLLAELVQPGGYLLVGFYHRWGRVATDLRRFLFRYTGRRFSWLDPRLRGARLGRARWSAWYADQYQNPHEVKYSMAEVLDWLQPNDLQLIRTIPSTRLHQGLSPEDRLFEAEVPGSSLERALVELGMLVTGAREGGFFTLIARKNP